MQVLREIEERGSNRAGEKAKKILQMMRGRGEEGKDGDWECRWKWKWKGEVDAPDLTATNRRTDEQMGCGGQTMSMLQPAVSG